MSQPSVAWSTIGALVGGLLGGVAAATIVDGYRKARYGESDVVWGAREETIFRFTVAGSTILGAGVGAYYGSGRNGSVMVGALGGAALLGLPAIFVPGIWGKRLAYLGAAGAAAVGAGVSASGRQREALPLAAAA